MSIHVAVPVLLLIDAGNTRVKWACVREQDALILPPSWIASGELAHTEIAELSAHLNHFSITSALISNVSSDVLHNLIENQLLQLWPDIRLSRFRSTAQCAGLHNRYQNPHQLGSDRFAAAIAARAMYPQQALVVATCGTATTVDGIKETGEFVGGMILPGLKTMVISLSLKTAHLPQIAENISLTTLFADNTEQAILSGCIHAQVGAIELAMQASMKDLVVSAAQSVKLLISGGAAPYILPYLSAPTLALTEHCENLVLSGLLVVVKSGFFVENP